MQTQILVSSLSLLLHCRQSYLILRWYILHSLIVCVFMFIKGRKECSYFNFSNNCEIFMVIFHMVFHFYISSILKFYFQRFGSLSNYLHVIYLIFTFYLANSFTATVKPLQKLLFWTNYLFSSESIWGGFGWW